ncbi:MAG: DUF4157 domain-containing protein [Leptospirales bacterium]
MSSKVGKVNKVSDSTKNNATNTKISSGTTTTNHHHVNNNSNSVSNQPLVSGSSRTQLLLQLQRTHGNQFVGQVIKSGILQKKCSSCQNDFIGLRLEGMHLRTLSLCRTCEGKNLIKSLQKNEIRKTGVPEEEPQAKLTQRSDIKEEEPQAKSIQRVEPEEGEPQTKMSMGAPGDVYEKEADSVAEQVSAFYNSDNLAQRVISRLNVPKVLGLGNKTTTISRISTSPRRASIFAHYESGGGGTVAPSVENRIMQSKGSGSPLPSSIRNVMALRTGHDFSSVRVKTGSEAETLNTKLGARAFTHGSDIWMGKGESTNDVKLMSHELTHVVQQGAAKRVSPQSIIGLSGMKTSDKVLGALQAMANGQGKAGALYAKEIMQFQEENSPQSIQTLQSQIMPQSKQVSINQKSDSSTLRACSRNEPAAITNFSTGDILGVKSGNSEGWIRGKLNSASGPTTDFPDYLKVRYKENRGGRDYFDILEGQHIGKVGTLLPGYLETKSWGGSVSLQFNENRTTSTSLQSRGVLNYGAGTVEAKIFVAGGTNKISPNRNYNLALPDYPHSGGSSYGDYAKTWFRIIGGPQGDEYLHRGDRSAGCVSVASNWPQIYRYLINKRNGTQNIGTIRRMIT